MIRRMRWRSSQVLLQHLDKLETLASSAERGRGFETFVAALFGHEHFDVEKGDLSSNGRQVDLFLSRGRLRLLVETKWTKRAAHVEQIDQLRMRLETAGPDVVGLLVSMSGVTATARRRVEAQAQRPILLLTGDEIRDVLTREGGLHSLISWKLEQLTRHQRAAVGPGRERSRPWLTELPEAGIEIRSRSGAVIPLWESSGGFHGAIFTVGLDELDWGDESITLDLNLDVDSRQDLVDVLRTLAQAGWVTNDGAWRIEQSRVSWNGFSAAELSRQLLVPVYRYKGRRMHHAEQVIYTDTFHEGLFTLTADVLPFGTGREIRWCSLSFRLIGLPLDTSALEAIANALPVTNNPVFRRMVEVTSSGGQIIHRRRSKSRFAASSQASGIEGLAYLTRNQAMLGPHGGDDPIWVEGVVLPDPLPRATAKDRAALGLPVNSVGTALCWLRQQHHLTDIVSYELFRTRTLRTSDTSVIRITADWIDDRDHSRKDAAPAP